MLNFFRKIRQKLLQQNKIGSYLKYAIGEILLVVIGILIAVSINDWNSENKKKASQSEYLAALKSEFEGNSEKLKQVRLINQNNIQSARALSQLMGASLDTVSGEKLRSLAIGTIASEVQYRPSIGVIEEIISSGKLDLFESDSLRYLLTGWSSELTKVQFQEKEEVIRFRDVVIDEMMKTISLKNATYEYQNNIFNFSRSKLNVNDFDLLNSLYLENNLVGFISASEFLEARYRDLEQEISIIIRHIKSEQNQL